MTGLIDLVIKDLENAISKQDVRYYYKGMPENLSKEQFLYGVICLNPVSQNITALTTGIQDMEVNTLEVVLAKSMQKYDYKNAQSETGDMYLARVMSGTDSSMGLLSNTIRYVIRNKMKNYGQGQPEINIEYDDDRFEIEGVVSATMTITQNNIFAQTLS